MNENRENKNQIDWNKFVDLADEEGSEEKIQKATENVLKRMSLEQKVKQMSGDEPLLWGLIKMGYRYNYYPIPAGVDEKLGIPGVLFGDGPRGCVLGESTCFPVSMARGAAFDTDLEERIGNAIAIELRAHGVNFYGGVCINLLRHPAWGRAQETYGEDPFHLGKMGVALTEGVQSHKVMACAKHYICNSMENMRFKVDVQVDERTLREIYLPHFKRCVDAGVASIMSAYNKVNGEYCGHNHHLLTDILKEDWGFKGFVISDFTLGVRDGEKAVKGGMDIEMPHRWRMRPKKLLKLLKKGKITEKQVNESVSRILYQKIRFAHTSDPELYHKEKVASEEHQELALEAAQKGIVLLKNEDRILPLQPNKQGIEKILVVGELADTENVGDKGSSQVYPPFIITPLQGLKNRAKKETEQNIEIIYEKGNKIEKATEAAKEVDAVIIVTGYTYKEEGEYIVYYGGDRKSLTLKPEDEALINSLSQANPNTIVVMEGGSAIITEKWRHNIPGILMAWYPGMMGGRALAQIIFGDVNPSGKLPCVFPTSEDQLSYFERKAKEITYDYLHGYRLIDTLAQKPAFHFGHGLSYTEFEYNNLKLDKDIIESEEQNLLISIDCANIGEKTGEEITQVYVGYADESDWKRAPKELKGFHRTRLKPRETKRIQIPLDISDLRIYNPKTRQWLLESGKYTVFVGASSDERILIKSEFEIK